MKRALDFILAAGGLLVLSPLLAVCLGLVWLQDRRSPFYLAARVGREGRLFTMVKIRTMVVNAEASGVDSTSALDPRITPLGATLRRLKLDEITQLWNVVTGDMSLVGPRPNVKREIETYTDQEMRLLELRPGITDFASIVFSDEGEILRQSADPDLDYGRLIRPWKSRLGIHYGEHRNLVLDVQLILLTLVALVSRERALLGIARLLRRTGASEQLQRVCTRREPLEPFPPPGSDRIVSPS